MIALVAKQMEKDLLIITAPRKQLDITGLSVPIAKPEQKTIQVEKKQQMRGTKRT